MDVWEVEISNLDEVRPLLEERGVNLAEVMVAIAYGETVGRKLVHAEDRDRSLVRAKHGGITIYADYRRQDKAFALHTAYWHRASLASDEIDGESGRSPGQSSQWVCHQCEVNVGVVDDIVIVYQGSKVGALAGFRCGRCGLELLSETAVVEELHPAEDMLFSK